MPGRATTYLLALILAVGLSSLVLVRANFANINGQLTQMDNPILLPDHETTWCDEDGLTHVVRTYCKEGESEAACAERHQRKVEAAKENFPPKGE